MKNITDTETPFQKFKQLTQRLIAVPKKEIDHKLEEYKRKNSPAKRKKKQS